MEENVDSNSNIISKSDDVPVETDLKKVATSASVADEEMVDIAIAAEEGLKENASEVSAGKEEWELVDAADVSAAAPTGTNLQSAPMVDRNETEGGVACGK